MSEPAKINVTSTTLERHHEQCPWNRADPERKRSVCGCPPGWPKLTPIKAFDIEALQRATAGTAQTLDVQAMRANLHATFNGGYESKDTLRAFHHGMDTVCNVLIDWLNGGTGEGVLPLRIEMRPLEVQQTNEGLAESIRDAAKWYEGSMMCGAQNPYRSERMACHLPVGHDGCHESKSADGDHMWHDLTIDRAIHLAELWGQGKMVGGDQDEVIAALLKEVKRLRGEKTQASSAATFPPMPKLVELWRNEANDYDAAAREGRSFRIAMACGARALALKSCADALEKWLDGTETARPPCSCWVGRGDSGGSIDERMACWVHGDFAKLNPWNVKPLDPAFIPDGTRCHALDERGGDFGRCGNSATGIVEESGIRYYVCASHELYWLRARVKAMAEGRA